MKFSSAACLCILPFFTEGFAPAKGIIGHRQNSAQYLTLEPDHVNLLTQAVTTFDHSIQHSSQLLADAASAAVDTASTAAETTKENDWWTNYLEVFKNALITVHSTIDEPLRSVGITQTWGVSIAIFTACVRSLLIPLSIQQNKSSEYQKILKPYMTEIKERYKDNKNAQNRAIGKLFEDANQNPLNGCLLSLAQLPVLLGLYRGIRNLAQDGVLNERFLWIPSLEGPVRPPDFRDLDWLTVGWTSVDGFPTPQLGWETTLAFLVMPVLLVLGQSLTMRVMTPPVDEDGMSKEEKEQMEKTQTILKFLPLSIGYFSLQVPAGLTIYWFTTNIFTLSQSLAIKAYYKANPPEINLPDYWDTMDKDFDEMSAEEKRAATKAGINVAPKFDELVDEANFHYIVQRKPLHDTSLAWKSVSQSRESQYPEVFKEWVEKYEPLTDRKSVV